jgi:dUTP pyrophosphatase
MIELRIFKTHPEVVIPSFATQESACFDISSFQQAGKSYVGYDQTNSRFERHTPTGLILVMPGERVMVPTGLILDIPKGYSVRLHPRSGLSLKVGITLANCEAVIDSDYFEELFLLITNNTQLKYHIHHGSRLAQGELVQQLNYNIVETTDRPQQRTDRIGGLGSTGLVVNNSDTIAVKRGRGRPPKNN